MTTATVMLEIADERIRQQEAEGFDAKHDDTHQPGELAEAASAYALNASDNLNPFNQELEPDNTPPEFWPWGRDWWKPGHPRRDLIKAAALIVAEIERIDRAAGAT